MFYQFVISPPAALGRPPILPLCSSHTPATSSPNSAITAYHQLTTSYLSTGRPSCVCRGAFSRRDITTVMYQQDRAVRTHPVAATSMTKCSHHFCTLTPYCCEPTSRIRPAEPISTGNIRLGTWTFSYGGLTVWIHRRDSGLARYFVATVGKRFLGHRALEGSFGPLFTEV